jgi:UDP-N-acetylmuramate dehydrogenase
MENFENIQHLLQENYPVRQLSTFLIGGQVKYFAKTDQLNEVLALMNWAKSQNLPIHILGRGSDILFSDGLINALFIKYENRELEKMDNGCYRVASALPLNYLLMRLARDGWEDAYSLIGIPGTVGGAVWANAGAYGQEFSNVVEKVKVIFLDEDIFQIKELTKDECFFQYRDSIFKHRPALVFETIVACKTKTADQDELMKKMVEILKSRHCKQPLSYPNAGSIFKNVTVTDEIQKILGTRFPHNKVPAAWLIEQVGLKGFRIGDAQFSEKHANFIVNLGRAKANDVLDLLDLAKQKVFDKFVMKLEEELIYIK